MYLLSETQSSKYTTHQSVNSSSIKCLLAVHLLYPVYHEVPIEISLTVFQSCIIVPISYILALNSNELDKLIL